MNMATLEQIQARMKKLQAQAESIVAGRAQGALDQIRALMLKHGLTTHDIEERAKGKRDRARAERLGLVAGKSKSAKSVKSVKSAGASKGKMPPKFRDPKTGATWSGHARPPAWIKNVKDRSKFLIDGGSASGDTQLATGAKAAGRKAAVKKTVAGKAAAKKTGVKKASAKTPAAKKTGAKKASVKASVKVSVKRAAPAAKKTAAKKTAVKKVATGKTGGRTVASVVKHVAPARKPSPSSSHVAGPAPVNGAITLS
jgi:DNA-binding protein H-NS